MYKHCMGCINCRYTIDSSGNETESWCEECREEFYKECDCPEYFELTLDEDEQ